MDESESIELLALCEGILEDDEVSVDEVRQLGQWLAEHEIARRSWPGEIITQPIQHVLLDGRVNKTELKKVTTLLRRVQKEAALREAHEIQQNATAVAAQVSAALDLTQARLPSLPITFPVTSHSDRSIVYEVDLSGPSCNCPDWTRSRSTLPRGDLTRCCKHTFDAFSRVRPKAGWPGWLNAFLEEGWRSHPETRWRVLQISGRQVLASTAPTEWANVFAPDATEYRRFGFSILERRWSYGVEPDGASQIASAILSGLSDDRSAPTSTASATATSTGGLFARVRRLLGNPPPRY
jgi:hypothetical protein